jgi:hypothetical protein
MEQLLYLHLLLILLHVLNELAQKVHNQLLLHHLPMMLLLKILNLNH